MRMYGICGIKNVAYLRVGKNIRLEILISFGYDREVNYSCKNAYLKYCLRADSLSAIVTGASPTIVSVKRDIKVGVMPLRSWIPAESKNNIKSLIISRQRLY